MSGRRPVALIGDSILLAGVAVSLSHRLDMQVEHIDPCFEGLTERLDDIQPGLIVTEMHSPWTNRLLAYLVEQPDMQLAGIDATNGRLIMLSTRQAMIASMEELIHAVLDVSRRAVS